MWISISIWKGRALYWYNGTWAGWVAGLVELVELGEMDKWLKGRFCGFGSFRGSVTRVSTASLPLLWTSMGLFVASFRNKPFHCVALRCVVVVLLQVCW